MAKIDYTRSLASLIYENFRELYEKEPQTYELYYICATYFDTFPDEILGLGSSELTNACQFSTKGGIKPDNQLWFSFLNEPIVMKWKSIRSISNFNLSIESVSKDVRAGRFKDTQQAQALKEVKKVINDDEIKNDGQVYIMHYFAPLLGPKPNTYKENTIEEDWFE